jgi:hypothetical protein
MKRQSFHLLLKILDRRVPNTFFRLKKAEFFDCEKRGMDIIVLYNISTSMSQEITPVPNFILYTTVDGGVKLNVTIQDETIWMTQKMMSELFDVDVRTVSEHLQNIFKTSELSEE